MQNHHVITLASLAKQVTGASAVTSSSDFRRPTNLGPGVEALRAKWGWIGARVAGTAHHANIKPGGVLFSSNPRGHNEEGWNSGRYGVYHDLESWRRIPQLRGSLN